MVFGRNDNGLMPFAAILQHGWNLQRNLAGRCSLNIAPAQTDTYLTFRTPEGGGHPDSSCFLKALWPGSEGRNRGPDSHIKIDCSDQTGQPQAHHNKI